MTTIQPSLALQHDLKTLKMSRTTENGGVLHAEISPASWMYEHYPFQLRISLEGGGTAYLKHETISYTTATPDTVQTMLDIVRLTTCRKRGCKRLAFDCNTIETNRKGKCESCFMQALNAEFVRAQKREQQKLVKLDAKYKAQGFTHRIDMWIHGHGDDQQILLWMKNPTKKAIKAELEKRGSVVLNDYTITEI